MRNITPVPTIYADNVYCKGCNECKRTQMYVYKTGGCFSSTYYCEDCKPVCNNPIEIHSKFIEQQR